MRLLAELVIALFLAIVAIIVAIPISAPAFIFGLSTGVDWWATLSDKQFWIPVVAMWALMLLWSKPWLDRFNYGPFAWLWRSLARGRPQPMRGEGEAPAPASAE